MLVSVQGHVTGWPARALWTTEVLQDKRMVKSRWLQGSEGGSRNLPWGNMFRCKWGGENWILTEFHAATLPYG